MELMVTIGIFSVISAVVIFKSTQFNSSIFLTNAAYEVALRMREVQAYGISARKSVDNSFYHAYGLHFDISEPYQFIIFNDLKDNYDPKAALPPSSYYVSDSGEEMFIDNLPSDVYIDRICYTSFDLGVSHDCSKEVKTADIVFKRPSPSGKATVYKEGTPPAQVVGAGVELRSKKDPSGCRLVSVEETGQISVKACP